MGNTEYINLLEREVTVLRRKLYTFHSMYSDIKMHFITLPESVLVAKRILKIEREIKRLSTLNEQSYSQNKCERFVNKLCVY
jgi:hypothetical protein